MNQQKLKDDVEGHMERAVCWIRRDLRLYDHVALAKATEQAKSVLVVFVFDTLILDKLTDKADKRLTFIYASLAELRARLLELGSELVVLHGDPVVEIPNCLKIFNAEGLFFNHDEDPYAISRDKEITNFCLENNVMLSSSKDHVVYEKDEILNLSGEPFKVFTPFSKGWMNKFEPQDIADWDVDETKFCPKNEVNSVFGSTWKSLDDLGFTEGDLWLKPGTTAAFERLKYFKKIADGYGEARNFPAISGTSGLSVHLRHGTISIRHCFREGMQLDSKGGKKWVSELIWREFYMMILSRFPHVVGGAFRPELDAINWPGSHEDFEKWCVGQTGFPLVDAAMRCLNKTGWMHNRLRMVTAMFLTKDLLVDWRLGEAYFAEKLLDFELASNNGGWQWSASTGVDSQPYFRIFNPLLQSQKFDTEAQFITEWCPELSGFEPARRHWPHDAPVMEQIAAGCEIGTHYPAPLVVHQEQKEKAIALFKPNKV